MNARPPLRQVATSLDLLFHPRINQLNDILQERKDYPETEHAKTHADKIWALVKNHLNSDYKHIVFEVPNDTPPDNDFQSRISFDTFDNSVAEPAHLFDPEDDPLWQQLRLVDWGGDRGRNRDRLEVASPTAGSPTRIRSPVRGMHLLFNNQYRAPPYPTSPIITRRGCLVSKSHKDFVKLYSGQLIGDGLWATLPGRVILIYISGRQHTWVALDWILSKFLENGDTVIIAAAVSSLLQTRSRPSYDLVAAKTPRVRQRQRSRPEYMKLLARDIMRYAQTVIDPAVIARLSVEINEGSTKDVLKDMYRLHEPNLVLTGTKVNTKSSAPLKLWLSLRLSDRLVKNFPLPLIVVPALNMGGFEDQLRNRVENNSLRSVSMRLDASRSTGSASYGGAGSDDFDDDDNVLDLASVTSEESNSSGESYSSFEEVTELWANYKEKVGLQLRQARRAEVTPQSFSNLLKIVSDNSLQFCEDMRGVDPDFRGEAAKFARAVTGSNFFGAVPYKTKSMLEPVESPKKLPSPSSGGMSVTELKRTLKNNAKRNSEVPLINVNSPSNSELDVLAPKSTLLKFVDEKPKRLSRSVVPLKKFLSHEDRTNSYEGITPLRSQPESTTVRTLDEKAKKKKKRTKLWGLLRS